MRQLYHQYYFVLSTFELAPSLKTGRMTDVGAKGSGKAFKSSVAKSTERDRCKTCLSIHDHDQYTRISSMVENNVPIKVQVRSVVSHKEAQDTATTAVG